MNEILVTHAEHSVPVFNPIVDSEVSVGFARVGDLDHALPPTAFRRNPLPWEAGFLAGKCSLAHRRRGGKRHAPRPVF